MDIKNKEWVVIDSLGYYMTPERFIDKISTTYRDCLLKMSENEIRKLFGNPSSVKHDVSNNNHTLEYYIVTPLCKSKLIYRLCGKEIYYIHDGMVINISGDYLIGGEPIE